MVVSSNNDSKNNDGSKTKKDMFEECLNKDLNKVLKNNEEKNKMEKEKIISDNEKMMNDKKKNNQAKDQFKELIGELSIATKKIGYTEPTKIQKLAIPIIKEQKDLIAGSATGSGKTLAFSANMILESIKGEGIQALILTPTRELAEQIKRAIDELAEKSGTRIRTTSVYGGVGINPQIDALRRTEIVVGTPGRLLDHLERGTIDLSRVKTLVLDEADMMLDMGFLEDVEKIISQTPKDRQTLLFSATINPEVKMIAKKHLKSPETIDLNKTVDPKKLRQKYFNIDHKNKLSLLIHLISERQGKGIIFCNSRKTVDFVEHNLKANKIKAIAIHGGYTQKKRDDVIRKFHQEENITLVCTDVAARGLDFKGISTVYNYDIPNDPKQYIHRIGRTARAGKEGEAINILASRDHDNFSRVLNHHSLNIPVEETPEFSRAKITNPSFNKREGPRRREGQGRQNGRGGRNNNRGERRTNWGGQRSNNRRRTNDRRNNYR